MRYVLDASALLRFIANEAGAVEVENLLKRALDGEVELFMSAVNWGEVLHYTLKAHGSDVMKTVESQYESVRIQMLVVDNVVARTAAELRFRFKLPYADAFAAAAALQNQATLVTGDYDFTLVRGTVKVQFLPAKGTSKNKGKTP
jgi:uncharacterized protein